MTPEQREKIDELSIRNIEVQRNVITTVVKSVNNIIFVVSAGTFAVSISFIGYLKTVPKNPWLLIAAWLFLFCAICLNVAVHYISSIVAGNSIKELNTYRNSGFNPYWNMIETKDPKTKLLINWNNKLTFVVFSLIFLGLLSLILFGAINLLATGNPANASVSATSYVK